MTKSSNRNHVEDPEKDSGPYPIKNPIKPCDIDLLMVLKNQKVMMRAMFVMMKTMAGDMEVAEEIKAQAKVNYDYIVAREG